MTNRLLTALRAGTILAGALAGASAALASGLTLRGDVVAQRDALTLGDLVADAPPALAGTPLFRAPALGQSGTIQAARIAASVAALGIGPVETGGRLQVTVTRAARRLGPAEMEAALKGALRGQFGLDPAATGVTFDGTAPALLLPSDAAGALNVSDLVFDRRARRLSATLWVGPSPTERAAALRVSGAVVETVEVAVLTRSLDRGAAVSADDVAVERRPRELVPADALGDGKPMPGRVARRALSAGSLIRPGDLVRPDLVARGEVVTALYETPGISLAMRVTASEAGALGDTITVVNPSSKKAIQATVTGSGRVSVGTETGARSERVASATP